MSDRSNGVLETMLETFTRDGYLTTKISSSSKKRNIVTVLSLGDRNAELHVEFGRAKSTRRFYIPVGYVVATKAYYINWIGETRRIEGEFQYGFTVASTENIMVKAVNAQTYWRKTPGGAFRAAYEAQTSMLLPEGCNARVFLGAFHDIIENLIMLYHQVQPEPDMESIVSSESVSNQFQEVAISLPDDAQYLGFVYSDNFDSTLNEEAPSLSDDEQSMECIIFSDGFASTLNKGMSYFVGDTQSIKHTVTNETQNEEVQVLFCDAASEFSVDFDSIVAHQCGVFDLTSDLTLDGAEGNYYNDQCSSSKRARYA